jgi:hypothetical protein
MTKSKLLASTMLVAAATAMSAVPANALDLKIGGFAEFWFGYGDNEAVAGTNNNFDVKQDAEITFRAEETLDNGMKVGFLFEMEAGNGNDNGDSGRPATGTDFDESFAWVKTSFGQFNIGNNDVAGAYVGGVSTVGPVGIIKSDAQDWIPGNGETNNTDIDLGLGDSGNITYFTPRVAGLQAIVSYTPDNSDDLAGDFDTQATTGVHQAVSTALKYSGKFSGVTVGLGVGYTTAELTEGGAGTDATAEGYNIAGKLGFGNYYVSGAYSKEDISDVDTFYGFSIGGKMGKHAFSLGYGKGEESQRGAGVGDRTTKVITAGYERNMGKGVTWASSVFKTSVDGADLAAADLNDGVGVVTGLKLKF